MSREQHDRVSELFYSVCDLDPAERAHRLDEACKGNPDLRSQVEALLRGDRAQSQGGLTEIVEQGVNRASEQFGNEHGFKQIELGPYTIVGQIGEGGMSVVYEALQSEPVKRRVALKVIRPGMDTRQVIARFESERQALALMDHPNIAKIFDGGETPRGRPYFVMELVKGSPVNEFCDARRLTLHERLDLICEVCEAVQHAHQKAIIHRDIKPTNILVSDYENRPRPKVIDFGIAKATTHSLTDTTLYTRHGAMLGTPGYMSPEQIVSGGDDVDTRTDVYSLGVVLYELLTGCKPFDGPTQGVSAEALRESVLTTNIPKPSTQVQSLPDKADLIANARRTTASALRAALGGDLDWIIMKAIDHDRSRRYASAHEMATDIRRFLAHEPVLARPPSFSYRVAKFVRRNRAGVTAAGLLALALIGGITSTSLALVRAHKAEAAALASAERANSEAQAAREVATFLEDLFEISAPEQSLGETITASTLLERGARRISAELSDQPLVQARMMQTIANVYARLAIYDRALPLAVSAVATHRAETQTEELATSLNVLGRIERLAARFDDAEVSLQEALSLRRLQGEEGNADTAETLIELGILRYTIADHEEAERFFREAIALLETESGAESLQLADALSGLGDNLDRQRRVPEAKAAFERALEIYRDIAGERHPGFAISVNNLGAIAGREGNWQKAYDLQSESLALNRRLYGPVHPNVATATANVGFSLDRLGRPDEAEAMQLEALRIREAVFGPDHVRVAASLTDLAVLYNRNDRQREALPLLDRILRLRTAALGRTHPRIAHALSFKGGLLTTLGEYAEAELVLDEAFSIMVEARGETHRDMAPILRESARLMRATGREEKAQDLDQHIADITAASE